MLPPAGQGPHSVDPLAADFGGEHWAEAVPAKPDGFVTDLDALLVQQVFVIAPQERVTDLGHHRQANDLWSGFERPEQGAGCVSPGGWQKDLSDSRDLLPTLSRRSHMRSAAAPGACYPAAPSIRALTPDAAAPIRRSAIMAIAATAKPAVRPRPTSAVARAA
jgi:hypothetical protein